MECGAALAHRLRWRMGQSSRALKSNVDLLALEDSQMIDVDRIFNPAAIRLVGLPLVRGGLRRRRRWQFLALPAMSSTVCLIGMQRSLEQAKGKVSTTKIPTVRVASPSSPWIAARLGRLELLLQASRIPRPCEPVGIASPQRSAVISCSSEQKIHDPRRRVRGEDSDARGASARLAGIAAAHPSPSLASLARPLPAQRGEVKFGRPHETAARPRPRALRRHRRHRHERHRRDHGGSATRCRAPTRPSANTERLEKGAKVPSATRPSISRAPRRGGLHGDQADNPEVIAARARGSRWCAAPRCWPS